MHYFQRHHSSFGSLMGVLPIMLLFVLAGCGGGGSSSGSSTQPTVAPTATATTAATTAPAKVIQVKIVEKDNRYSFDPASITIPKGSQIVWTNTSDAPHTVTSDSNAFTASSNVTQNQTFKMVFNMAGTYTYHCSIHPYMKATIIVTS